MQVCLGAISLPEAYRDAVRPIGGAGEEPIRYSSLPLQVGLCPSKSLEDERRHGPICLELKPVVCLCPRDVLVEQINEGVDLRIGELEPGARRVAQVEVYTVAF